VAIQVLASSVETHGGPRVGMSGGDLHIAEDHPWGIEIAPSSKVVWAETAVPDDLTASPRS
jgi:hypothetical protein